MTDDLTKNIGNPKTENWKTYSIATLLKQNPNLKSHLYLIVNRRRIVFYSANLKTQTDLLNPDNFYISQPGKHNTKYWNKSIEHHFIYFQQHLIK